MRAIYWHPFSPIPLNPKSKASNLGQSAFDKYWQPKSPILFSSASKNQYTEKACLKPSIEHPPIFYNPQTANCSNLHHKQSTQVKVKIVPDIQLQKKFAFFLVNVTMPLITCFFTKLYLGNGTLLDGDLFFSNCTNYILQRYVFELLSSLMKEYLLIE